MKRIILDYFKRWWLVLSAIFIAYFLFQAFAIRENNSQPSGGSVAIGHTVINTVHNVFIFQVIMWLGFLLIWEMQRGAPRVLTSLPIPTKQIGRAWWLAAVAFPAIAIGVLGSLAILIFSSGTNIPVLLENYLAEWSLIALYLGAMFGAQTLGTPDMAGTLFGKIRALLSSLLFVIILFGFIFNQLVAPTLARLILFFFAAAILSVLGWFRAEQMVLQRASFRLSASSFQKNTASHQAPQGFGGLPYLAQRSFVRFVLASLALIAWMTFAMSFIHVSNGESHAQVFTSAVNGGSTPWFFFMLMFSIVPMVFQLRALRTLPIPSSTLAATMVFLPIFSIAVVGVIITTLSVSLAGQAVMLQTINSFLMMGAKVASMVVVIVWRGLDAVTYLLAFLLIIADSFISLGVTLTFHLGSKTPEQSWWIPLVIFLLSLAASFALTQRLLTQSSSIYRVRTMPANAWSMARR